MRDSIIRDRDLDVFTRRIALVIEEQTGDGLGDQTWEAVRERVRSIVKDVKEGRA